MQRGLITLKNNRLARILCIILLILVLLTSSFLLVQFDFAGKTNLAQAVSIIGVLLIGIILIILSSFLDENSKRKSALKLLGIYLLVGAGLAVIVITLL